MKLQVLRSLSQLWVVCLGSPTSNYISKCTGVASNKGRKIWHNLLKHQVNILQSIWAKHLSRKISAKSNPIVPQRNPDFCYTPLVSDPSRWRKKNHIYIAAYQRTFFRPILNCDLQAQNNVGQTNSARWNDLNWAKLRPERNLLKEQTTNKNTLQRYNSF